MFLIGLALLDSAFGRNPKSKSAEQQEGEMSNLLNWWRQTNRLYLCTLVNGGIFSAVIAIASIRAFKEAQDAAQQQSIVLCAIGFALGIAGYYYVLLRYKPRRQGCQNP